MSLCSGRILGLQTVQQSHTGACSLSDMDDVPCNNLCQCLGPAVCSEGPGLKTQHFHK